MKAICRYPSAEGTGRKGTIELHKTLGSQLNRTELRIWNVRIFDLVPPSGQTGGPDSRKYFDCYVNPSVSAVSDDIVA